MIHVQIHVVTRWQHVAVEYLHGKPASWEGSYYVNPKKIILRNKPVDRFTEFNSEGPVNAEIGLSERLNGPSGTYSSAEIRVGTSMRCAQTKVEVDAAHDLLFEVGMQCLERYIPQMLSRLYEDTERQG